MLHCSRERSRERESDREEGERDREEAERVDWKVRYLRITVEGCSVWQTEESQKRLCLLLTTDHLRSCLVFVAKL